MRSKIKHLSGKLHVTGQSQFVEQIALRREHYFAYPVVSKIASGKIKSITTTTLNPDVIEIITWDYIPGINNIAHGNGDIQPLLPREKVSYIGQPIAVVVATSQEVAIKVSRELEVEYKELPSIFTIEDGVKKRSEYSRERAIRRVTNEVEEIPFGEIEGSVDIGGQEHFYFETQRCYVENEEDNNYTVYSSTQAISEVQEICARILDVASHSITVDVKRLGGAFGGKEAQATLWAGLTTLCSYVCQKAIFMKLEQADDMAWTGKRHAFKNRYSLKYDKSGKIISYKVDLKANGGAFTDLSNAILERGLLHADSGYFIPNMEVTGNSYRTNYPPNTAFRGFGAPQGIMPIEIALEKASYKLGIDQLEIRKRNVYSKGDKTHYGMEVHDALGKEMFSELERMSDYANLKKEVELFNAQNRYKKRGIGIMPGKFGISFTAGFLNQGSALVWIYSDGSISLSHGGIEMGQQLYTKIAYIVSSVLGVSIDKVRNESTNTKRIGNSSPTAASSGTDLNGFAAKNACEKLKKRLQISASLFFKQNYEVDIKPDEIVFEDNLVYYEEDWSIAVSFKKLAHFAYMNRVNLGSHGFYKTPGIDFDSEIGKGTPFYYFVFGACLIESEVDILTGSYNFRKIYVAHDNGLSLNEEIDKGQIYGAVVQGLGYCTLEEIKYSSSGANLASTASTYKIPTIMDVPRIFKVEQIQQERDVASVLGSKAVGEPPFIYGLAGWFSLYNAISYVTNKPEEINLKMPATPESVLMAIEELKKRGLYE